MTQSTLAAWVAELMAADGITVEQMTDLNFRQQAVAAYLEEVGRKIEAMQTRYLTNDNARSAFAATVHQIARG